MKNKTVLIIHTCSWIIILSIVCFFSFIFGMRRPGLITLWDIPERVIGLLIIIAVIMVLKYLLIRFSVPNDPIKKGYYLKEFLIISLISITLIVIGCYLDLFGEYCMMRDLLTESGAL